MTLFLLEMKNKVDAYKNLFHVGFIGSLISKSLLDIYLIKFVQFWNELR